MMRDGYDGLVITEAFPRLSNSDGFVEYEHVSMSVREEYCFNQLDLKNGALVQPDLNSLCEYGLATLHFGDCFQSLHSNRHRFRFILKPLDQP